MEAEKPLEFRLFCDLPGMHFDVPVIAFFPGYTLGIFKERNPAQDIAIVERKSGAFEVLGGVRRHEYKGRGLGTPYFGAGSLAGRYTDGFVIMRRPPFRYGAAVTMAPSRKGLSCHQCSVMRQL